MTSRASDVAEWHIDGAGRPLIATAIHDGHHVRDEVADLMVLDEATRLREEDPYSRLFTEVAPTRVVGLRSRFEIDLNRPREEAICTDPDSCWGLEVWRDEPPDDVVEGSLALHDAFYEEFGRLLHRMQNRYGGCVVLDIHNYNHRRGDTKAPADPAGNPEVNVGTGSLDRSRWGNLVDRFIEELSAGGLDVRENVKFKGRYLAQFTHDTLPETGCCLALEFKKTFVDEWTGELDERRTEELIEALRRTIPGLLEEHTRVLDATGAEAVRR